MFASSAKNPGFESRSSHIFSPATICLCVGACVYVYVEACRGVCVCGRWCVWGSVRICTLVRLYEGRVRICMLLRVGGMCVCVGWGVYVCVR